MGAFDLSNALVGIGSVGPILDIGFTYGLFMLNAPLEL
jgi:hypothetical protein